jgi:hypothetical protein
MRPGRGPAPPPTGAHAGRPGARGRVDIVEGLGVVRPNPAGRRARGHARHPWLAALACALAGCTSSATASREQAAPDAGLDGAALAVARGPSEAPCGEPAFAADRVSTQCAQFVDERGRVLFFHGVNARVEGIFDVTFDDGRAPLEAIPALTLEDAQAMRAMGFNALRLPLSWSALEPTKDGGISQTYLDRVQSTVALAARAGVRTLLDMHQDAYSKEIGEDGAPLWAILPAPPKLLGGPLTDLGARRISIPVLSAFGTLFADTPDGVELRRRFALAVAAVATRFAPGDARHAASDGVLGIEIINEPITNPTGLAALRSVVTEAVRAADPGRLVFFEPDVLRSTGDKAPLSDQPAAPGSIYSPHVYTLAFGGTDADHQAMTKETLRASNANARAEADSWGAPLAITEFGYAPDGIQADGYLRWQTELQDEYQASGFFWLWKEESQGSWGLFDFDASTGGWAVRDHVRQALSRVTPEAVAGWPTHFGYDQGARRFDLAFKGDRSITAPSRLYVPSAADFTASFSVTCDGTPALAPRDATSGIVEVKCGGSGDHVIVLAAK